MSDAFSGALEASRLSPLLLKALHDAPDALVHTRPEALALVRSLAEHPSSLTSLGWVPLLQRLLAHATGSANEQGAHALLDALYLTLYFVRRVGEEAEEAAEEATETRRDELLRRLLPLLSAPSAAPSSGAGSSIAATTTLVRLLLSPSRRLAAKAAHTLCLLSQLLGAVRPHQACRSLLVADGAAGTLLTLFDREDRPQVQQRALKAMGWLRAADAAEFHAALASCPELSAVFHSQVGAAEAQ